MRLSEPSQHRKPVQLLI